MISFKELVKEIQVNGYLLEQGVVHAAIEESDSAFFCVILTSPVDAHDLIYVYPDGKLSGGKGNLGAGEADQWKDYRLPADLHRRLFDYYAIKLKLLGEA